MKKKYFLYSLRFLIAVFIGFHLYHYFRYVFSIMRYPYLVDYGESFVLNQALLLRQGFSIFDLYASIESAPFLLINYPPLYPGIVSLFQGGNINFIPGRIVSFISTMGIVTLSVVFLRQFRLRDYWVLLFPLALLSTYSFYLWSALYRVDMLALFFLLAGLVFLRREKMPSVISAIFLIMAVYTRQTLLAFPCALFLTSLYTGNRRWQKTFLYWLGGSFMIFLILNIFTDGEFFWHTVVGNRNIMMISNLKVWGRHLIRFSSFFVLCWIISMLFFIKQKTVYRDWTLLIILFSIFSALFVLTIAKVGSAVNYLLEWYISMILVIALAVGQEKQFAKKIIIYLLLAGFLGNLFIMRKYSWASSPRASDILSYRRMQRMLSDYPGPIISYDGGIILMSGKEIVFQPFVLTQLSYQYLWTPHLLLEHLEQYPQYMVILNFPIEDKARIRYDVFPQRFIEQTQKYSQKKAVFEFTYQSDLFCYIIAKENKE